MLRRRGFGLPTAVVPAAAALLMLSFEPAAAQSVANFYSGKTVSMLIGFSAGGGCDASVPACIFRAASADRGPIGDDPMQFWNDGFEWRPSATR
jgi:hypothetical protein